MKQIEVQKRQISLEAEITKPAEAEQTKIRLMAQAENEKRKILADADAQAKKLNASGDAEATKLRAIAESEAAKAMGLGRAEATKAQGMAEAQIIAAKGQAEAESMYKKAEAFRHYNEAAVTSMIVENLPKVIEAAASPLAKVGNMTVLSTGSDASGGASKITGEVFNIAAQGITLVKGLTGHDLTQLAGNLPTVNQPKKPENNNTNPPSTTPTKS